MPICNACKRESADGMEVLIGGRSYFFDCFDCAVQGLAPRCGNCMAEITRNPLECEGMYFCREKCLELHQARMQSISKLRAARAKISCTEWVDLAAFEKLRPARSLQGWLKQERIESRVREEAPRTPWWGRPFKVRVGVQVEKDQLADAQLLMASSAGAQALLREAMQCPVCQSLRVRLPGATRRSLVVQWLSWFKGPIRPAGCQCWCADCHHTWQPSVIGGSPHLLPAGS